MSTSCPVKFRTTTRTLNSIPTEFILADYGSHLLFQITQVGKVGWLVKATRDKPEILDGKSTFSIVNLLGPDEERVDLLARIVVEKVNLKPPYKSLLLGYSCNKHHPTPKEVCEVLGELGIK